ncbi:RAI1 like PD-XK nuclease-domain-containing protein [Dichotomopilus funicola]|uniref:Decapping nuclease n=1 Tax=Dichotomopilus funicola TaxID=1934379 RepID=A0AAN6VDI0_9PEZI|nr:RAI1 like PD-XK nuclease-domain-containing protein [Dichotomopilus funicola]
MVLQFPIQPPNNYSGASEPVKRPKEFACFSYDKDHQFRQDDSSMKWYYPPDVGANLSNGYDGFIKHDDRIDEHLDSLLRTMTDHEKQTGQPIDAHIVTWRGMLTKIMATPFDDEGFEMNATLYRDCIFIEEHHAFKEQKRQSESHQGRGRIPLSLMQYWGYKFETLSTLPQPWGETSREYIENRDQEVTNNKEQYCSVVRTGFGKSIVCLGGEVDAIWDKKPQTPGEPINWVELKTSAEIRGSNDQFKFDRKLMRYWIQSFLLGVPKIIVGFRNMDGILTQVEELKTISIPDEVQRRGMARWDGNVCIKFTSLFLEWLRTSLNDEGVWRIRRPHKASYIELFKVEEVGHGNLITDDFMNWRIKLSLSKDRPPDAQEPAAEAPLEEEDATARE